MTAQYILADDLATPEWVVVIMLIPVLADAARAQEVHGVTAVMQTG